MSIKVNADTVLKNFQNSLNLAKNMKPLMQVLLGVENDSHPYTLRGSVLQAFLLQKEPRTGTAWAPLTSKYFQRKQKKYPGQTSLIASRRLFNSLQKGAGSSPDAVVLPDSPGQNMLTYGSTVGYLIYHMRGTKNMSARPPMGLNKSTIDAQKKLIGAYMTQVMKGVTTDLRTFKG